MIYVRENIFGIQFNVTETVQGAIQNIPSAYA